MKTSWESVEAELHRTAGESGGQLAEFCAMASEGGNPPELDRATVRLGTPGRYGVSVVGEQSGCRMDVDLRAELDTALRTYDARRGLTEPPPPDRH